MAKGKNKGPVKALEDIPEGDVERVGIRRSFTVKGRVILLMGAILALAEAAQKVADALVEAGYLAEDAETGKVRVIGYVNLRNGAALIPGATYPKAEAGARVVHRLQAQGDIYTVQRPIQNKVATPPENKDGAPKPEDDDGNGEKKPETGQGEGGGQNNGEGDKAPGEEG